MLNLHWKKAVENAESLISMGEARVYLGRQSDISEYPWQLATSVEEGGTHRLDMDTSWTFEGHHESGLTLAWSFDLEPASANGEGGYRLDMGRISAMMVYLSPDLKKTCQALLLANALKVTARGDLYSKEAARQYGDAAILRALAAE